MSSSAVVMQPVAAPLPVFAPFVRNQAGGLMIQSPIHAAVSDYKPKLEAELNEGIEDPLVRDLVTGLVAIDKAVRTRPAFAKFVNAFYRNQDLAVVIASAPAVAQAGFGLGGGLIPQAAPVAPKCNFSVDLNRRLCNLFVDRTKTPTSGKPYTMGQRRVDIIPVYPALSMTEDALPEIKSEEDNTCSFLQSFIDVFVHLGKLVPPMLIALVALKLSQDLTSSEMASEEKIQVMVTRYEAVRISLARARDQGHLDHQTLNDGLASVSCQVMHAVIESAQWQRDGAYRKRREAKELSPVFEMRSGWDDAFFLEATNEVSESDVLENLTMRTNAASALLLGHFGIVATAAIPSVELLGALGEVQNKVEKKKVPRTDRKMSIHHPAWLGDTEAFSDSLTDEQAASSHLGQVALRIMGGHKDFIPWLSLAREDEFRLGRECLDRFVRSSTSAWCGPAIAGALLIMNSLTVQWPLVSRMTHDAVDEACVPVGISYGLPGCELPVEQLFSSKCDARGAFKADFTDEDGMDLIEKIATSLQAQMDKSPMHSVTAAIIAKALGLCTSEESWAAIKARASGRIAAKAFETKNKQSNPKLVTPLTSTVERAMMQSDEEMESVGGGKEEKKVSAVGPVPETQVEVKVPEPTEAAGGVSVPMPDLASSGPADQADLLIFSQSSLSDPALAGSGSGSGSGSVIPDSLEATQSIEFDLPEKKKKATPKSKSSKKRAAADSEVEKEGDARGSKRARKTDNETESVAASTQGGDGDIEMSQASTQRRSSRSRKVPASYDSTATPLRDQRSSKKRLSKK